MASKSKSSSKRHISPRKNNGGGLPAKSRQSTPPASQGPPAAAAAVAAAVAVEVVPAAADTSSVTSASLPTPLETLETKQLVFKDPNFVHSCRGKAATKKARVWRTLRQVIATDKLLPWKPNDATYSSIEAPPSFKPAKKYSDITGLPAPYTDPQTKIRYHSTEEFARIRMLPSDITTGYLALRKANVGVQ